MNLRPVSRTFAVLWCALALASGCGGSSDAQGDEGGGDAGEGNAGGTSGQPTGGASGQPTGGTSGQPTGGTSGQPTGGTSGQPTGGTSGQPTGGTGGSGGATRTVDLTVSSTFGFDESPGAALAVAVDEEQQMVLVVALKYVRPFYMGSFMPTADAAASAAGFDAAPPFMTLVDDAAMYPIVTSALTDIAGVRTISASDTAVTAILLEGDLQASTPSRIYVAHSGTATLTRPCAPSDILEGEFQFTEVTGLGSGAMVVANAATVSLDPFFFEFDTNMPALAR